MNKLKPLTLALSLVLPSFANADLSDAVASVDAALGQTEVGRVSDTETVPETTGLALSTQGGLYPMDMTKSQYVALLKERSELRRKYQLTANQKQKRVSSPELDALLERLKATPAKAQQPDASPVLVEPVDDAATLDLGQAKDSTQASDASSAYVQLLNKLLNRDSKAKGAVNESLD